MTIEKDIIDQILRHPRAATLVKKANLLLKEERERRLQFYNDITDEEKVCDPNSRYFRRIQKFRSPKKLFEFNTLNLLCSFFRHSSLAKYSLCYGITLFLPPRLTKK